MISPATDSTVSVYQTSVEDTDEDFNDVETTKQGSCKGHRMLSGNAMGDHSGVSQNKRNEFPSNTRIEDTRMERNYGSLTPSTDKEDVSDPKPEGTHYELSLLYKKQSLRSVNLTQANVDVQSEDMIIHKPNQSINEVQGDLERKTHETTECVQDLDSKLCHEESDVDGQSKNTIVHKPKHSVDIVHIDLETKAQESKKCVKGSDSQLSHEETDEDVQLEDMVVHKPTHFVNMVRTNLETKTQESKECVQGSDSQLFHEETDGDIISEVMVVHKPEHSVNIVYTNLETKTQESKECVQSSDSQLFHEQTDEDVISEVMVVHKPEQSVNIVHTDLETKTQESKECVQGSDSQLSHEETDEDVQLEHMVVHKPIHFVNMVHIDLETKSQESKECVQGSDSQLSQDETDEDENYILDGKQENHKAHLSTKQTQQEPSAPKQNILQKRREWLNQLVQNEKELHRDKEIRMNKLHEIKMNMLDLKKRYVLQKLQYTKKEEEIKVLIKQVKDVILKKSNTESVASQQKRQ